MNDTQLYALEGRRTLGRRFLSEETLRVLPERKYVPRRAREREGE